MMYCPGCDEYVCHSYEKCPLCGYTYARERFMSGEDVSKEEMEVGGVGKELLEELIAKLSYYKDSSKYGQQYQQKVKEAYNDIKKECERLAKILDVPLECE